MSKSPPKPGRLKVVGFALVLSVICSLMITLAAGGLKQRQLANQALDKKINLLKAAGLMPEKRPPSEKINRIYDDHIQEIRVDAQGKILPPSDPAALTLYLVQAPDGNGGGTILPITTKGLWGKIEGYLAFEADGQTVAGFSIFSHSETPGLGGEIESAWFARNFVGKKIINSENRLVSVGIAKGKASALPDNLQDHYVDGISGATLTGKYLSQGIKQTLETAHPVVIKFKQRQLRTDSSSAPESAPETKETAQ